MSGLVWVELDAEAPDHNLRELCKGLKKGIILCAVVKANAYGHGVEEMIPLLPSADWFAVNSLEEGIELREAGEKRPILILGYIPLHALEEAILRDLDLTVYNRETLEALARLDLRRIGSARLHLKVETGTGRQGILPEEIEGFVEQMKTVEGTKLIGVSTHFANIEDTLNHDYAQWQLDRIPLPRPLRSSLPRPTSTLSGSGLVSTVCGPLERPTSPHCSDTGRYRISGPF
jgi:alanine racemase